MNAVRKSILRLLWLAIASVSGGAFAQAAPPVATAAEKIVELNRAAKVALVEGDVTASSSGRQKRMLVVGDYIVEGDSIVTGKDGELHLDMEDGGYLSVRPNTKMRIVKYQARGEATDTGVFGLLEGSFRSVTGWIGKFNRDKYVVRTPTATIGIRGTDHEPFVIPKGSSTGEPGTYDKVNEGGSFIQTPAGRAEVAPNQSGFVSYDKAAKPRVLKVIPMHFRAGRHEGLFSGKHAEVQARIVKHREDRRTAIRQKLQNTNANTPQGKAQKQQTLKEKREANQKQREDAKKAREDAKLAKQKQKVEDDADTDKGEHTTKDARKVHPLRKQ